MKILKFDIRVKSFIQKGIKNVRDDFFVALITGYQGSGKTYLGTQLTFENSRSHVYTNIKSLKIPNKTIHYFTRIEEI